MPKKLNRTHKDGGTISLQKAMHLPSPRTYSEVSVDTGIRTLPSQLRGEGSGGKKKGINSSAGYDVKTVVSIPSAKSLSARAKKRS